MPNDPTEPKKGETGGSKTPDVKRVSFMSSEASGTLRWRSSDDSGYWIRDECETAGSGKPAPKKKSVYGNEYSMMLNLEIAEQPLFNAIAKGDTKEVTELLQYGASIDITSPQLCNVFHFAAITGNTDILKMLLDHDPVFTENQVNALTNNGYRPIHFAFENGHIECVKLLLFSNNPISLRTGHGSTGLHIAARKNNLKLAEFILQIFPEAVHYVDRYGWTPLHTAIFHGSRDVIRLLIINGADLSACTTGPNKNYKTAIEMIMTHLPNPTEFLEKIFDTRISIHSTNKKHELELCTELDFDMYEGIRDPDTIITVDYSILLPRSVTEQSFAKLTVIEALLNTGNSCGQRRLLIHPMLESFVYLKWQAFLHIFLLMVINYSAFVLALTIFVMTDYGYKDSGMEKPYIWDTKIWMSILYLTVALVLFQETFFLSVHLKQYIFRLETTVKLVTIILAIILPKLMTEKSWTRKNSVDWPRHIATLTILLAWVHITFLLSKFPSWGYYALMFGKVCKNVLKIIMTFACLMIGFALSFMIQLHHQAFFQDLSNAIIKTMVMMTSEFDYSELLPVQYATNIQQHDSLIVIRLLFVIFLIFVGIVLMNLMVSVSVNDLKDLEVTGHVTQIQKQVEVINGLGYSLESWVYKLFLKIFLGPHNPKSRLCKFYRMILLDRSPIKQIIERYSKTVDRMRSDADKSLSLKPYEPMYKSNKAIPAHVRDDIFKIVATQKKIKSYKNELATIIKQLNRIERKLEESQTDSSTSPKSNLKNQIQVFLDVERGNQI